jgi:ectoine/hydroxyectoine ABC transporter permease protein EhuC
MFFSWEDIKVFLPPLLSGAKVTILLTVLVMALALAWGLLLALARLSRFRVLRILARFYVEVIRGTPLLLQLFYAYYVLPFVGIKLDPFSAGTIGLTVNYSAYLSEVYRAGIQAVDKGQIEAGLSLGMSRSLLMRRIILPQAIRIVLPPIGNYFISLFKDTSLVSIITLKDLMFTGEVLAASTFKNFEVFTLIALIYLAICYPGALGVTWMEQRLRMGQRARALSARGRRLVAWSRAAR